METYLKIKDIKLWARVGVLEQERDLGQLFSLDVFLWSDFELSLIHISESTRLGISRMPSSA